MPLRASSNTRRGRRHRNSAAVAVSTKGSRFVPASLFPTYQGDDRASPVGWLFPQVIFICEDNWLR
jgi:hypothetical protein